MIKLFFLRATGLLVAAVLFVGLVYAVLVAAHLRFNLAYFANGHVCAIGCQ
jgi:hypothetical protein